MPDISRNFDDFKWHDHTVEGYRGMQKNDRAEALVISNQAVRDEIIGLASQAKKDITRLYNEGDYWGFITRFQVVTPMKKTVIGIGELNTALQNIFNPSQGEELIRAVDKRAFRLGDKIVHLRNQNMIMVDPAKIDGWMNDSDKFSAEEENKSRVMNGQLGIVEAIHDDSMVIYFPIERTHILYDSKAINSLSLDLGYALTVHKTQGSEYSQVVFPVSASHWNMLNPRLLYTAMTRAKDRLDMVGQKNAFAAGCRLNDDSERRTCIDFWCKPKKAMAMTIKQDQMTISYSKLNKRIF